MSGPDFSSVDSQSKAEALGGDPNRPENVVYVPVGIGAAKERIDNTVVAALVAPAASSR